VPDAEARGADDESVGPVHVGVLGAYLLVLRLKHYPVHLLEVLVRLLLRHALADDVLPTRPDVDVTDLLQEL
jgi:hypothetical protein